MASEDPCATPKDHRNRCAREITAGTIPNVMVDPTERIRSILLSHPAVLAVRSVGSRANDDPVPLSDWDFEVDTSDFAQLKADLPGLVRVLEPLMHMWDPGGHRHNYMLILPTVGKVDLIFPDQPQVPSQPWVVTEDTLNPIDHNFWDWILWLASKHQRYGVAHSKKLLKKLYQELLGPMGVSGVPTTVEQAVRYYTDARSRLEAEFGVRVDRNLEAAVAAMLSRQGFFA